VVGRRQVLQGMAGTAGAAALALWLGACRTPDARLVVAIDQPLEHLDPQKHSSLTYERVLRFIYEPLVYFDAEMRIQPGLATNWQRLDDRTMQFTVRSGVKNQNGENFVSEALAFTLMRAVHPVTQGPFAYVYDGIEKTVRIDSQRISIVTKQPDPALLERLSGYASLILPSNYFTLNTPEFLAANPVGTGPYKLAMWSKRGDIVLDAHQQYWGGAPRIKRITFRPIPNAAERGEALRRGDVDIAIGLPVGQVEAINRSGAARAMVFPGNRVLFGSMDLRRAPFDNKRVRQAMSYAADIGGFIQREMAGAGSQVATLLNPWYRGYEDAVLPFSYDPEKARSLLREAGYPSGGPEFNLHAASGQSLEYTAFVQALASSLSQAGFRPALQWQDWSTIAATANTGKLDGMAVRWWDNWLHDAGGSLYPNYHSSSSYAKAWQGYSNERLDRLLEEAGATLDARRRPGLYTQAQRLLQDDCPGLFGFAPAEVYGVNNRVEWSPRYDGLIMNGDMVMR
jgi:peptide/nickel transport system substrate-binding protein